MTNNSGKSATNNSGTYNMEEAVKMGRKVALNKLGLNAELEKISSREVDAQNQVVGSQFEIGYDTSCSEKRRKAAAARRRKR